MYVRSLHGTLATLCCLVGDLVSPITIQRFSTKDVIFISEHGSALKILILGRLTDTGRTEKRNNPLNGLSV